MYNYRCDVNTGFERLKAVNQVQPYTRQQINWESFDTLVNLLTASVEETFETRPARWQKKPRPFVEPQDTIHEEKKRAPEIYFKQKQPRTRGKQLRTTRRCVEYPRE